MYIQIHVEFYENVIYVFGYNSAAHILLLWNKLNSMALGEKVLEQVFRNWTCSATITLGN